MTDVPLVMLPAFLLAGYMIGSIPFGVILSRSRGVDLRKVGSGNVGATNVSRVLGPRWGILCFVLDVGKGAGPVLAAGALLSRPQGLPPAMHQAAWLVAGCGAILGHVFSPWLGFRGGKGVATSLGVVLGIFPYFTYAALCAFGVWIIVTWWSRYVSLGSIVAALSFLPLLAALNWPPWRLWPMCTFAAIMVALILVRHRDNIRRLLRGTENKIRRKEGPPTGN